MNFINPLVSVIIPTYNRETLVYRAVKSVLAQTYQNLECIVVDDYSTDDTLETLTKLSSQDKRLKVISHLKNLHASAARNTGISATKGELIAFLDDDDAWLPEKLEKQVQCISTASSKVGLVYCWFDIYREQERVGTRRPKLRGYIFDKLLTSQPLGNASTLLVRREVIDHIGGFDESLPRGNDGDFIRRVGQYYEIEVVAEVLVHYFIDHEGNQRITGIDQQSILNGIKGHEAKLKKFPEVFDTLPKQHAMLLAIIGREYARIGETKIAYSYLVSAIKRYPISLNPYSQTLRAMIEYLFKRIQ
ncbi:glycosyl transferase family 2 [Halothece sp. PCC 7418]|uniref:glycosyltransferase family 2 protein n=1 Tax=Halothece sp. (strain PCC 7418) TaxID=65093 RepID=UPI0002A06F76|nr:glycosyltransferase family A protein [Halothece sp. PCC 7418]AFZ45124.1 glycosyl transferase family 2 [Halothece sp. PCC 7418]